MNVKSCLATGLLSLWLLAPQCRAASLQFPATAGATEAMMESVGMLATFLGLNIGPDPAASLSFSSSMDVPAGSFSYTLTAPSSYLGLSFASFNGTGSYDAPGGDWNFSGAGDLDHGTISGSGSSVVIPSGQEPDAGMSDWDYNWNGHTFHFHADCNYFDPFPAIPNLFSLRSTCTFTDKDTGAKYMATDVYNETNGAWMFTLMAPAFNVNAAGVFNNPVNGGAGLFNVTVTAVPEPALSGMLALAITGLFLFGRYYAGRS